jgi:hypothetical protein
MGIPTLSEFGEFVTGVFGSRGSSGSQEATAGMGFIRGQCGLYAVIQKGLISDDKYKSIDKEWRKKGWDLDINRVSLLSADLTPDNSALIDSSHLTMSTKKKGEWTGFHAEMMILSAMMNANGWRGQINSLNDLKALVRQAGGAMIAANATTCKHCGNLMTRAGIEVPGKIGNASLTAWWNPILDKTFPQADQEFAKSVPGFS